MGRMSTGTGEGMTVRRSDRYGLVFLLVLGLVVFLIAAPDEDWARAVGIGLAGAALAIALTISHSMIEARRTAEVVVVVATCVVVAGIALGIMPHSVVSAYGAVITGAIPPVIRRGVWRMLRTRGVTLQAVAGALVIYLSIGLLAAWIINVISQASHTPYFAQDHANTLSDRVYFSFATLTTTGYGDLTAATGVGRALAVVEMLTGQLYLVTVIGLLIGSYVGRDRAPSSEAG
jgi:Ion channel